MMRSCTSTSRPCRRRLIMMMMQLKAGLLLLLLLLLCCGLLPSQQPMLVHAWSSPQLPTTTASSSSSDASSVVLSRRQLMERIVARTVAVAATLTTTIVPPAVANAAASATSSSSSSDLERVRLGHARIRYLLDNWNSITEICGTNVMSDNERRQVIRTESGQNCNKTPLRVQEYMGYKSTTDPLYKIDKLLVKAGSTQVDADDYEDYLDCVERYREKADQTALLAYTSSWGEANPNGSKEVIDDYLEQTKAQVVESEKLLRSILGYLKLEPINNYNNGK